MATISAQALLDSSRATLERLTPDTAWTLLSSGEITLVDTRCGEQLESQGTVPGAIHAPLSVLYWRADPQSDHHDPRISGSARRIVLLCAHGYSSSLAAATLQQMGHAAATDVVGGFAAWQEAGLPVEHTTIR